MEKNTITVKEFNQNNGVIPPVKKKRGGKARKGYFYEEQEQAVIDYINAEKQSEKNKIFQETLYTAFTKMIESIIRRYNLYVPDEVFDETFDDTMSFLVSKLDHFKPDKGYKSYSYCGTICKNYLIYKINQYVKNQKRNLSYDSKSGDFIDSLKYSYNGAEQTQLSFLNVLMDKTTKQINSMICHRDELMLTDNEVKVGNAIIELLTNWEELFIRMGSDKFNKSSILMFLKETTLLTTKEIRDSGKKFKKLFYENKKKLIEEGF